MSNWLNDVSTSTCEGKILKSRYFGNFKVIKCESWNNVEVEFIETNLIRRCSIKEVKTGAIKDYLKPSVFGVGYLGSDVCVTTTNELGKKKAVRSYDLWYSMLNRLYGKRVRKTYQNCKLSENFKNYTYFHDWCKNQVGYFDNFSLDKDLLSDKYYSENTCVFLPTEINSALTKREKCRGEFPIGVYLNKRSGKFVAQVNKNTGSQEFAGCFDNALDAFNAYKVEKEFYMKALAEKWKGKIDDRAYNALLNYKVRITD